MPNTDELYESWQNATIEGKPDAERLLYAGIRSHVRAVVMPIFPDCDPSLPDEIADTAILDIPSFRGESAFSTWLYQIAANKANTALERFIREEGRRAPLEFPDPGNDERDRIPGEPIAEHLHPDVDIALTEAARSLGPEDQTTLEGMLAGVDQNALAETLRLTPDGADSKRRRLRDKIAPFFTNFLWPK